MLPSRLPTFILAALIAGPVASRAADPVVTSADASIAHDSARQLWTMANATLEFHLQADPRADLRAIDLVVPQTRQRFTFADESDATLTVDDKIGRIGREADGYTITDVKARQLAHGVELVVQCALLRTLTVTRHYALYDASPVIETWTTVASSGGSARTLSDLRAFVLTVPSGTFHWINGLRGDAADVTRDDAFSLSQRIVADGDEVTLGSSTRSSEEFVPWFIVEGAKETFFGGVMWSGAWTITAAGRRDAIAITAGLAAMTTSLAAGAEVTGPHGFYGVVPDAPAAATAAMAAFIVNGVRGGRTFAPLVTYNTWFAYGTRIDESVIRREMEGAASTGVELFVLDAGWYEGAGAASTFDFESGLGRWVADSARFPSGLFALTEYAHTLGMKFGIWMEPERVFLDNVGRGGDVEEPWLATSGGSYESARTAQICLASDRAREWLTARIGALLDEVRPDYLKWDNNSWINCDRPGHGHGGEDGNFAHVTGLYALLSDLRERYPNLLIENVSGGGNRLDLGLLRYTDVGWMDDRTAPSVRVRHNVQGLSTVFPPAYLLSFALEHDSEPLHNAPDLALYLRSRMAGILGLCLRHAEFSEGETADLARQIAIYKSLRDAIVTASATLLTAQAGNGGPVWDAIQARSADGTAIILAVQNDVGVEKFTVSPRDLLPAMTYDVNSVDQGRLGSATGASLMREGIDVFASPVTAAHILVLTPAGEAIDPLKRKP